MGVENPEAAYMGAEEMKLCAITLTKPALVTNTLEKIPEPRDSTLGAALWRPGSPWLRYFFKI